MFDRRLAVSLVFAAAIVPYFLNLGATSIIDANEAFYTETPREMMEAGDYVSPTFNYEPRLNKPPLSYWAVVASYKAFGVSLASARLPIVLGSLVILATAFGLGRIAGSTRAGLLAALTLAATPRFLLFSRRIIIDVYTAMFLGLTLLLFVLAETQPRRRRAWLLLMYAAIGLGVMTKGPVALVLPGLVCVVYLIASRRFATLTRLMLPTGAVVVAAIVVPYYAQLYLRNGWEAIGSFLMVENLARYADGVGAPSRGPLFYLPVLFADLYFPWSLLLPAGCALVPWRRVWRMNPDQAGQRGVAEPVSPETVRLLLGLWIVVIVAFFSLSKAQQDLYILPCVVAAAALVGGALDGWINGTLSPRLTSAVAWILGVVAFVFLVLGGGLVWLVGGAGGRIHLAGATLTGAVLCVGAIAAWVALARRSALAACAAIVSTLVVGHWILVLWALPDFERYKPVPHLARAIQAAAAPGDRVGMYRVATPSLTFYLRRHVDQMFDLSEVAAFFRSSPGAYCVMRQEEYEPIRALIGVPTVALAASPRFDAQLRDFLDAGPLPNLVVVTNRITR
ncbi:MAG: glycosyltransferase family 39 protein [Acidobacteriota bacterium]